MVLDMENLPRDLPSAALYYGTKGLAVFPCASDKTPLTKHGFKDATTDLTQISKWWQQDPNALIGMPTGEVTGIDVLDIDDPEEFDKQCEQDLSANTTVKTRKGRHIWFKRDRSQPLTSRVRPIPGADTRGDGGYVIVPPSSLADGAYYFERHEPLKPMPADLMCRVIKKPKPKTSEAASAGKASKLAFCSIYADKALQSECQAILNAKDGAQEFTLNTAALKIGSLVAGGELDRATAHNELMAAAMQMVDFDTANPWTESQLDAKIRRGLNHGALSPRSAPQSSIHGGITAQELSHKYFAPLKWIVPNVLPEGCYLLTARPKVGKSWLGLQTSLAVALGLETLGQQVSQGKAIYLALEDNQRRLQDRLRQLRPGGFATPNLILFTEWPRFDAGGLDKLKELIEREKPKLIVIDTLAKVRPAQTNSNVYEQDYKALAPLTELANRNRCCIVVVHHNRKGKSDVDALEQISGSLGLVGAVDGALVIDGVRSDKQYKLSLIGRDIPSDDELAISRKSNGEWEVLGSAQQVFVSAERKQITDLLSFHPQGLKPKEIADLLGKQQGATRKLLSSMLNDRQVKVAHGVYSLSTHTSNGGVSGKGGNTGNAGNGEA